MTALATDLAICSFLPVKNEKLIINYYTEFAQFILSREGSEMEN